MIAFDPFDDIDGFVEDANPTAERWSTACHEAAHLVAAWNVGVKPLASFLLAQETGASGVAYHGECDAWAYAHIAAAGLADLADVFGDPPERPTREPESVHADDAATRGDGNGQGELVFPACTLSDNFRAPVRDASALGAWVTRDDDWERWTFRAQRQISLAAQSVRRHASRAWAVAERLFFRGRLSEQDLEELLPLPGRDGE